MKQYEKICAYCKYFQEPFGYFDEMSRCVKRHIPVQADCTCIDWSDNFYTDLNDDEQGDTITDSGEFNFE